LDDVLAPLLGPVGYAFAALWGAIWGSFFNVCIARIPEGESIQGRSRCRSCGAQVRWFHNVPIVSWLWLRGRCASCGAPFSFRYLLVELCSTALSVLVFAWMMATGMDAPVWFRLVWYLVHFFFAGALLTLSFIDLATFLLPNAITYPGIPAFALAAVLLGRPWTAVLIGVAAGYLSLWTVAMVYERLTGREGMGLGDAKLLALIGGFLGWQALIPTVFLAALQGSVVGIVAGVIQKRAGKVGSIRHVRLPFGPWLSLGALEVMFRPDALELLLLPIATLTQP